MVKGHLDQQRSNLRSTKPKVTLSASVDPDDINFDTNPVVQDPPAARTQFLYADFAEVTPPAVLLPLQAPAMLTC
jgi:hypothetical protein